MVSVTVDAGWRKDRGQAIQDRSEAELAAGEWGEAVRGGKLQGRETQGGPIGRV